MHPKEEGEKPTFIEWKYRTWQGQDWEKYSTDNKWI